MNESQPAIEFPPVELALDEPDGLLATGGNLLPQTLINAYSQGIFPWYSLGQPIMWWSPNPRAVMFPDRFQPSKSLKKTLRRCNWTLSLNRDFQSVITACANQPRNSDDDTDSTWITEEMIAAYCELHTLGRAHSLEVWEDNNLIGGLYGVASGNCFSGESMFHRQTDASKVAFAALCYHAKQNGIKLIDCQVSNPHLTSLGVTSIAREQFIQYLREAAIAPRYNTATQNKIATQIASKPQALWRELALTRANDYADVFHESFS